MGQNRLLMLQVDNLPPPQPESTTGGHDSQSDDHSTHTDDHTSTTVNEGDYSTHTADNRTSDNSSTTEQIAEI